MTDIKTQPTRMPAAEQPARSAPTGDDLGDLPRSVQEIALVIGRADAMRLIGQLPTFVAGIEGKQSARKALYVPKRLPPRHRLVRILGAEKALKLVEAFGGRTLQPANCRYVFTRYRDEAILRMLREGASVPVVLSVMRVSRRYVDDLRARAKNDPAKAA